ncbi:MAG: family 78 glycoside hydrolase catalytic domain [Phycisphaerales bacterium]|jgi:alpha-L-rhamnosidase|nr:family 78 glycoside hydrolase catalytic domain [Phycisphaerales bacterium]
MSAYPKHQVPEFASSHWIGGPGQAFCRHEFDLPAHPTRATLKIIADPHTYAIHHWQILPSKYKYEQWLVGGSFIKYRLYANGQLAALGPFRPIEDGVPVLHQYDLTTLLNEGPNALAVLSRGEQKGFALVLEVSCADGSHHQIRTGRHWKQLDANAVYRPVCWEQQSIDQFFKGDPGPGEYREHLDGRAYPQGWRRSGFDDSAWKPAICYGVADHTCETCSTPPYELTRLSPQRIQKLDEGNFLIDFGRALFGGIELACPTGEGSGGVVELRLAEELQPNGHARFQLRTGNCYQELWTFTSGSEPLSHMGLRMFRYAEILGWKGELTQENITAIVAAAPFDPTRSSFSCDDPRLEQVWQLCKNSVAYTTADVYTDCLTRERLAYEADAFVTMLTQFNTEGSHETARRTLAYLIGHPTFPCEWWQTYIPLFYEYLLHTGDMDFVRAHYTYLRDRTSFHSLIKNGLIQEFPHEPIIDWPPSCRDEYEFGPANAVPNAYAHWDLQLLEQIARWLGHDSDADRFAAIASELHAGFNRELFDPSTGLYVDSLESRHSSLHANLFALRFGLVPPDRVENCLQFIVNKGMSCSIFTAQYLLETLFQNGQDRHAVDLMTRDDGRSWLHMIHQGATVTCESWLADDKPNMSRAHPWGSSPAHVIVRHLFGLRPTAPGWSQYTFNPRPGGLNQGKLSLLTPRGWMHAQFKRRGDQYDVDLQQSDEKRTHPPRSSAHVIISESLSTSR